MSTLSELQADLAKYKATRDRILENAQYMQDGSGRQINEAKLDSINEEIRRLEQRIAVLDAGGKLNGYQPVFGGHGAA